MTADAWPPPNRAGFALESDALLQREMERVDAGSEASTVVALAGVGYALLACCERLDRIAGALEPDVTIATDEPSRELLADAANDARILAQHRGDDADAEKYDALWRQLCALESGLGSRVPLAHPPGLPAEARAANEQLAGEALAVRLEELLTAARESLPIGRLRRAMSAGLGPVSVGVTGEPPHEEELDPRCGTPLMKQHAETLDGTPEIEAVCFLQQGHHGAHRSDRGHIWS